MEVEDTGDAVGVEDPHGAFDPGQVSVVVDARPRLDAGPQHPQPAAGEPLRLEEGCVVFTETDGIGGVGGALGNLVDPLRDDHAVLGVGHPTPLGGPP